MKFLKKIYFYVDFTYALLIHFTPHIVKCIKSGKLGPEESEIIKNYWSKHTK